MALIADSGAIYAFYDSRDKHHSAVADLIGEEAETIILPMAILAEIDYLLRARLGTARCCDFSKAFESAVICWSL